MTLDSHEFMVKMINRVGLSVEDRNLLKFTRILGERNSARNGETFL